ncbi:hypothetical protein [Deinococcus cellulosilyticus]|uniref:Uncharacterized protein n=1 Tax=Deinococcus cellulosilyticus (strain DSM 18568 / NBRC 106333 / KACC 11606 / 5516J-15) TaxID=1223518 RepID=A0A511N8H6_DEIC1|nr:hypothetical protein [Deinococcus cellulosilyticus]GEM49134.1 hypothetical protein DC3_47690 [Deinococcus cellulosilyticus NBRC 106333 = KACC 11606]
MSSALATTCAGLSPFVDIAPRASLVVQAKVLRHILVSGDPGRPTAMVVRVEQVFRGSTKLQEITVYGEDGMTARPDIPLFPVGSHWLFPLVQDWLPMEVNHKKTDFALVRCSVGGLVVLGDQLYGMIDGPYNSIHPVKDIPALLKRPPSPYWFRIEPQQKSTPRKGKP